MAALDGMKVLDLTQYEAGTTCSQYLAWFGAEVVKVELPGAGDPGRATEGTGKDSLYFLSFNHNKKSVAINLGSAEGRELFLQLVPKFDVVVENFSLGTMEKLGLGYDVLNQHNPGIIYATIKGFGTTGPYKEFKCFDWVAQAAGGAFSVTGEQDGPPMRPAATVADTGTGNHAALGILAAYIQKLRTGEGQVVEISMQETMVNFMKTQIASRERFADGVVPRRGNRTVSPTNLYPCAPGGPNDYVFFMVVTQRMWDALAVAMDRHDLCIDERFLTVQDRLRHGDELDAEIAKWTRERTKFEVMEYLGAAGVPVGAVYDSHDVFNDRHLAARGQIITYEHPTRGEVKMPAPPIHLSKSEVEVRRAPLLGEHTGEVLAAELGLSEAEMGELAERRVLGTRDGAGTVAARV
ncbi:MAG: CoA transferase [Chloroflexi bacterium]|nr:CoA transferase [Chloroflexota bacterium]